MKRVCTGPMQFAPYRPWSPERRAAARARVLARIAMQGKPVPRINAPLPDTKLPIHRIAGIEIAGADEWPMVVFLNDEADDFHLTEHTAICAIHAGGSCFEFAETISCVPGWYYVDAEGDKIEIGAMNGEFPERAFGTLSYIAWGRRR